jgi:hypothetical protein
VHIIDELNDKEKLLESAVFLEGLVVQDGENEFARQSLFKIKGLFEGK